MIPYGKQNISDEDVAEVIRVLKGDFLTQGPEILAFEQEFAEYIGSQYAVAVANGTAALHLSALALGCTANQKVITSPITFAASANCVRYCGAEVVFADIDPDTYLISYEAVEKLLKDSPKGTYSGIIPVDFAGRSVDMERFKTLADEYGLWLLEDACHAPGGYFIDKMNKKQNCGNGQFADLAIFSFHPVKHIASGEGGMISTNDKILYQKLLSLRTHGISRNTETFQNELAIANADTTATSYPGWYMEMQTLGYNYRITDFQAALGKSQLKRANEGLEKRKEIARKYFEAFKDDTFIINQSGIIEGHAYHLYVIEVENRLGLYNYLRTKDIYAQVHYIPCHLMPYYQQLGWAYGDLPKAESYYKNCLSIPMYPTLTAAEQQLVIESIKSFYNA